MYAERSSPPHLPNRARSATERDGKGLIMIAPNEYERF